MAKSFQKEILPLCSRSGNTILREQNQSPFQINEESHNFQ